MRGKIYNEARAKQLRDFSGLKFNKITPTDIDGLLDFGNRLFVLIEAKYKDPKKEDAVALPHGQRLALGRVCDAIADAKKIALVLIITHSVPPSQVIDFAKCQVVEYRFNKKWKPATAGFTCRSSIEWFLDRLKIPY